MLKKIFVWSLLLAFAIIPATAIAHYEDLRVAIFSFSNKAYAFTEDSSGWHSETLQLNEKIISTQSKENIGIMVTNQRILAFSRLTKKWIIIKLTMNEILIDSQIGSKIAGIKTNKRLIGIHLETGKWFETKK